MPSHHADTTEIARIADMGRGNHARKSDRICRLANEPPMSEIEFRNRRAIEERKPMKLRESVRNLIVVSIDFAYPVHRANLKIVAVIFRALP
jgi:hypothetical protein